MNLDYMREFVLLAGCLNFTQAAQKLHLSQPALTKHIHAIEKEIGAPLLIRSTHQVTLTPYGEMVAKEYAEIVQRHDELLKKLKLLKDGYAQQIRFGTLYYGIGLKYSHPLIKTFRAKTKAELTVVSCQPHQVLERLLDGSIDVGLSIHSRFYQDERFAFVTIRREPLYAIVLPGHPLAGRASITVDELAAQHIIAMRMESEHRDHTAHLFQYHGLTPGEYIYTDQIDTLRLTMEETNGVFVGTRHVSLMPGVELAFIPIASDDFYMDVCLIYRAGDLNPAIFDLLECASAIE